MDIRRLFPVIMSNVSIDVLTKTLSIQISINVNCKTAIPKYGIYVFLLANALCSFGVALYKKHATILQQWHNFRHLSALLHKN